ncbi:Septum-associated rare lipoprotein A [hydrothermal vent metagenome]|uniref:Septum-associated rare lipoprotein A n=1 Tax=hydrothermal vent metagenome TaxID=652676 RepID=A0A3B0VN34_9ZZZZ
MWNILFLFIFASLFIAGCSTKTKIVRSQGEQTTNAGRYAIHQDMAPDLTDFDISTLEQWNIQPESKSRYGNHSPYVVFGKTYYLANAENDFEQTGIASWYGKKFHGHTTSNMEIFDMYKLTAAHRTLPLPSYVEVTNLENNKKVIVRVNDRGPFKSKRIIDLSWAAAKVLEYDNKGLADVHIRLIQAPAIKSQPNSVVNKEEINNTDAGLKFLQVGAFSQKNYALDIAKQLSQSTLLPVHVTNSLTEIPLYRVRIGPLLDNVNIIDIIQQVHRKGFSSARMVVE